MDSFALSLVVDLVQRNFCLFTSMQLIQPNGSLLYLHSNDEKSSSYIVSLARLF